MVVVAVLCRWFRRDKAALPSGRVEYEEVEKKQKKQRLLAAGGGQGKGEGRGGWEGEGGGGGGFCVCSDTHARVLFVCLGSLS